MPTLLRMILRDPEPWFILAVDIVLVYSMLFAVAYAGYAVLSSLPVIKRNWRPGAWTMPALFGLAFVLWWTPLRTMITSYFCGFLSRYVNRYFTEDTPLGLILAVIWLAVAAFILVRLARDVLRLRRGIGRLPDGPDDPAFAAALETMGMPGVRVKETEKGTAVSSWGVRGKYILVPAGFLSEYTPEERRGMYLHELVHLRRRDTFRYLAASVAQAALWFQPAVHLAVAAFKTHLEIACDGTVLARCRVGSVAYGRMLTKAVAARHGLLANFTDGGRAMRWRMAYILGEPSLLPSRKKACLAALACLTALLLFFALFTEAIGPDPRAHLWRYRDFTSYRWGGMLGHYTYNMEFKAEQ